MQVPREAGSPLLREGTPVNVADIRVRGREREGGSSGCGASLSL